MPKTIWISKQLPITVIMLNPLALSEIFISYHQHPFFVSNPFNKRLILMELAQRRELKKQRRKEEHTHFCSAHPWLQRKPPHQERLGDWHSKYLQEFEPTFRFFVKKCPSTLLVSSYMNLWNYATRSQLSILVKWNHQFISIKKQFTRHYKVAAQNYILLL